MRAVHEPTAPLYPYQQGQQHRIAHRRSTLRRKTCRPGFQASSRKISRRLVYTTLHRNPQEHIQECLGFHPRGEPFLPAIQTGPAARLRPQQRKPHLQRPRECGHDHNESAAMSAPAMPGSSTSASEPILHSLFGVGSILHVNSFHPNYPAAWAVPSGMAITFCRNRRVFWPSLAVTLLYITLEPGLEVISSTPYQVLRFVVWL